MFVRDIKSNEVLSLSHYPSLFLSLSFSSPIVRRFYGRSLMVTPDFRAKRLLYDIVADSRANLNIYPQTDSKGKLALCGKWDSVHVDTQTIITRSLYSSLIHYYNL